jgi:peptidoglycan/LPS O-acetylase OafA/YrhL
VTRQPHGAVLQPAIARSAPFPSSARPDYNASIGYLRAFVRLLVFAFHSVLAYYPGPFPFSKPLLRMAVPVLDSKHFAGARILVAFNEISAMSLMFFLSGLFLWPSLTKKGAAGFLRERTVRLGFPFLASAGLVAAIAYYPEYLLANPGHASIADYGRTWLTLGRWMSGPAWFLLVLFIYDLAAVGLYVIAPQWGRRLGDFAASAAARPWRFCVAVIAVSALAYAPLALAFGPYEWWHIGPFWLQQCRALQYAAYFFIGAGVGAYGLNRGLTARDGMLARGWKWWGLAAIAAFLIVANILRKSISAHVEQTLLWGTIANVGWVVCCAICSFALLALFLRFTRRSPILDNFANNSYAMYLVHYMFVTWAQYALLPASLPAPAKALCVFTVVIAGSWLLAAAVRRIPAVARII